MDKGVVAVASHHGHSHPCPTLLLQQQQMQRDASHGHGLSLAARGPAMAATMAETPLDSNPSLLQQPGAPPLSASLGLMTEASDDTLPHCPHADS